jgi:hypothetical protein
VSIATRLWAAAFSASTRVTAATILMGMSAISTVFAAAAALAVGHLGHLGQPSPAAQALHAAAANEITIGHSAQGRPIRALRVGSPRARVKLLVIGSVHGNERAGEAVIERLRRARPPRGTSLWLVEQANPDGAAAGARPNAHGVDLNRNFPYRWREQDGVYESGSGPAPGYALVPPGAGDGGEEHGRPGART